MIAGQDDAESTMADIAERIDGIVERGWVA
jgi:hypothetical protein